MSEHSDDPGEGTSARVVGAGKTHNFLSPLTIHKTKEFTSCS